MLSSIATIAAAVTAVIGVIYKVYYSIKKAKVEREAITRQELANMIKGAKTDDERKKYSELLNDIDSK